MSAPTTPMKAIRAKCLDCVCGSSNEVKLCPCDDCSLYPYRLGRNPYRAPKTEAQRAAASARLAKMHAAKASS